MREMIPRINVPTISVVIPVYNGLPYLKETVQSFLSQTYKNFELLLIDDGSTDALAIYLSSIIDSRIRIIRQKNLGLCASMNRGIIEAKSTIIARCDQDDVSLPVRLERQYKSLIENDLDCVFSHIHKIGSKHIWSNIDREVSRKGNIKRFSPFKDGCLVNSTMMAKKEVLLEVGGYRAEFYPSDDWDLELRLSENYKIGIIQEPLVKYRFHKSASTRKYFFEMQHKRRWAEDCYYRRQQALTEFSYREYMNRAAKPSWRALNRSRKDIFKLFTRNAGEFFLCGNYVKSVFCFCIAAFFAPLKLFSRFGKALTNNLFRLFLL